MRRKLARTRAWEGLGWDIPGQSWTKLSNLPLLAQTHRTLPEGSRVPEFLEPPPCISLACLAPQCFE